MGVFNTALHFEVRAKSKHHFGWLLEIDKRALNPEDLMPRPSQIDFNCLFQLFLFTIFLPITLILENYLNHIHQEL